MKKILLIVAITCITLSRAQAQAGALDTSFDPGAGIDGVAYAMVIANDGKIIIGGNFTSYDGVARKNIARINTDGSLDTTFDPGTGTDEGVYAVAVQSDGKILIGGYINTYDGTDVPSIARLNTDGSLDTSFDAGTGPTLNSSISEMRIQPDGKIVVVGGFGFFDGIERNSVARLNADGSVDTSFDPGMGGDNLSGVVELQPDGKIVVGGYFSYFAGVMSGSIARLNSDGTLDESFVPGEGATGGDTNPTSVRVKEDGKILLTGNFSLYQGEPVGYFVQINADGSLDESFDNGSGANDYVYEALPQADGKIIITGDFTAVEGASRNHIARMNADGSVDETFNPEGPDGGVYFAAMQTDGKIVITGYFENYNGTPRYGIARILNETPTNIVPDKEAGDLGIYPNPCNDIATIDLSHSAFNYTGSNIIIRDINGKTILQQNITSTLFPLNVASLSKGIYSLSVESKDQCVVRRLVVE